MIEKKFVDQKIKEFQIQEFIGTQLGTSGYSHIKIQRTPIGEKIIIYTSRPGLVVGRKGENIKKLTITLKKKFQMENPQIEIGDIENPNLNANSIAERIVYVLEKYGSKRFKSIGYKCLQQIMDAGALGAEIVISGKVPSARARKWRFYAGYLKKSGYVSETQVRKSIAIATLKSGVIGVKVKILPSDVRLPDKVILKEPGEEMGLEEIKEEPKEQLEKIPLKEEKKIKKPTKETKIEDSTKEKPKRKSKKEEPKEKS